MKTNTIYIFIISGTLFAMSIFLFLYTRAGIFHKTDVIKEYYQREKQNNSFDFEKIVKKDSEKLSIQEAIIKKIFLDKSRVIDFITKIETTGKDLDVVVQNIKYGDSEKIENTYSLSPILFNLEIKGSLPQIENFIKEMTQSEVILTVNELRLYKIEGENPLKYRAYITIKGTTISYE